MMLMTRQSFSPWMLDLIIIALLFSIAFSIRIKYQEETIVYNPIQKDAKGYFFGAYNLHHFGVFSTEPPGFSTTPPRPSPDRVPGYSLFVSYFIAADKPVGQFLAQVKATQALLGSLLTIMSYMLARFCFSRPPAFIVGCLTGISPHLVSMDNYLLSESLFTFVTMTATLVLMVSWKKKNKLLAVLAGEIFGFSTLIRPVALLLGPFLALIYIMDKQELKFTNVRIMVKLFFCFILGISIIYGPFFFRNKISLGKTSDIGGLLGNIVLGSYVNLTHKNPTLYGFPYRDDQECERMRKDREYFIEVFKKRFQDDPWAYIKWYAGGKILCSWRWNMAVGMGDVYVYPVKRSGFHSGSSLLPALHRIMRWLHWPLVILAFLNPFILVLNLWRGNFNQAKSVSSLPSILIIVYHAVLFTILFPLPRYTIPLRPYCYLLSVGTLLYFIQWIKKSINRNEHTNPNLYCSTR